MKKNILNLILICLFSNIILAQGGDNAATAAANPISIPFSATGTTVGATDDYQIPFAPNNNMWNSEGNDWVYYFCPTSTDVININITHAIYTNPLNPSISVWDGVPGSGTLIVNKCVMGSAPSMGVFGLSFTPVIGQCYYILIDNFLYVDPINGFPYSINVDVTPPLTTQPECTNIGFEDGNLNGWRLSSACPIQSAIGLQIPFFTPTVYNNSWNQAMIISSGNDPFTGFPMVCPSSGMGSSSVRLGDGDIGGGVGACLEQKFSVTSSNALFTYNYAVVMTDHNGTSSKQPFFKVDLYDCNGNSLPCGSSLVMLFP